MFGAILGGAAAGLGLSNLFSGGGTEQVNRGNTEYARKLAQQQYDSAQYDRMRRQLEQRFEGLGQQSLSRNMAGQYGGFAEGASGLDAFMSYSPQMQQLAFGQFSPMTQQLNAQAADQARLGMQTAQQQYSNIGAGRSGAAAAAASEAAARPFAQVQNQLGMQQLASNAALQQQLLGQTAESARLGSQQRLQAGQFDMGYGLNLAQMQMGLAGMENQRQQQALGVIGSIGQPVYAEQPGFLDQATQLATIALPFAMMSDERLKKDVETFEATGEVVDALRGVTFTWKSDDEPDAGVIAQEVEAVLPRAVVRGGDGYVQVKYHALVGLLLEEVKSLRARVATLESEEA